MEETEDRGLSDFLDILRRRRWYLILPAVLIFAIAAAVAVLLPATYRSSATILIEQQQIPQDLVRSTVSSYADQRVQVISQRVMTTATLGEIVEKYNLYRDERKRATLPAVVDAMRKEIQLNMMSADVIDPRSGSAKKATIAFTLAYDSESPPTAQKVTSELVSLFLNENLRKRKEAAAEASSFLAEETDRLASLIADLEARLAVFKESHGEKLPEMQVLNRQMMQRADSQLRDNDQSMRLLEERVIFLEAQLAQLSPSSFVTFAGGASTGVERIPSTVERLRDLEAQYVSVGAHYGASHPDRIRLEREIVALRREAGTSGSAEIEQTLVQLEAELSALHERYSSDHPDVKRKQRAVEETRNALALMTAKQNPEEPKSPGEKTTNPAYLQLQTQLKTAQLELQARKGRRVKLEQERSAYEARLAEGPKIEREYLSLTRDYDNSMTNYREVKAKQMEAELAESLEAGHKAERFVLIEPPLVPSEPIKPNRLAILVIGFALSIGGGLGAGVLRELASGGMYGAKAVAAVTGAVPLAVIPYIETDEEGTRKRRRRLLIVLGLIVLLAGVVAAVHFFFRPLDLIYLQILQRAGLA